MSDIAIPRENWFSADEYARRLVAVRAQMSLRELGALVVVSPAHVCYLTGHHSIDSWEFRAAVVTHDRPPALLLYQFEQGRILASSWLSEARFYDVSEEPVLRLAWLLDELDLHSSRIGIERHPMLDEAARAVLRENLPRATLVPANGLVEQVRHVKSEPELACIHRAAELTRIGMRAARDAIGEGALDHDIAAAATSAMLRAGGHHPVMPPTVAAGYRSGLAHSEHAGVVLRCGDSVFVELSGCWRHYSAPLMHTAMLGKPTDEWREINDVAHRVADEVVESARPDVSAAEVARRARAAMAAIEDRVQFHYNFGYSLGISFPPHWLEETGFHIKENNPRPLEAGMVFHVPLTMRVLGRFAAGTSRTIEITPAGARVLTGGEGDSA